MIWSWIKKRLGYHVCEEFTQWEVKTFVNDRWQERRCTICGAIQQRRLKYGVPSQRETTTVF